MTRRIAFYGGSFDPPHHGHLEIACVLTEKFELDEFTFIPAFHAPHKVRLKPTSAYDRYTMLCLVTADLPGINVSKMEIEVPERPYTIETLTRLNNDRPDDQIFFVMGADSWMDIKTWREWEKVLLSSNHIVVTRPGYDISFDHVTHQIRERIVDLRNLSAKPVDAREQNTIYITDAVNLDISSTEIRSKIRGHDPSWPQDVAGEVANYIEKYQIYN